MVKSDRFTVLGFVGSALSGLVWPLLLPRTITPLVLFAIYSSIRNTIRLYREEHIP